MKEYDVTIVGAGLAGLYLAKSLAIKGLKVLLVDRKNDLAKGIHTTGIFVRKTLEDFDFPPNMLGRPISRINLFSPSLRKLELVSPLEEFRVGRMGLLYGSLLNDCRLLGVEFKPGTRYTGSEQSGSGNESESQVSFEKGGAAETVRTAVLVGADGARSRVAKDLGLDENREWIVGYEEVFSGLPLNGSPVLHCFLDSKLAPGYLAWISNDGDEAHIGVGGYPSRFDPRAALKVFKQEIVPQIIDTNGMKFVESRGGRIPVGGVLKRIANKRGLLIGDAAGAVSPLTAGGLDPCLRLSKYAAAVITNRFDNDNAASLRAYSGSMFRSKFGKRILMRAVLKNARSRSLIEAGFTFLSSKIGQKIAERIFFKRASFPDVEMMAERPVLVVKGRGY